MVNFMLMKISCKAELQKYYFAKFLLPPAFRLPPFRFLIAIILLLIAAGGCRADDIILKDGRVIRCDSAREEGNVVRYFIGDAALTIARDRVERIEHGTPGGEALESKPSGHAPSSATSAARLAQLPGINLPGKLDAAGRAFNADALDKLEANVKAEPNDAQQRANLIEALNSSGYVEYQAGHFAQARALFTRALIYDQKDITALLCLATIELKEGRYTEAVRAARKAVEADPKNQPAYYQLGLACYALEDLPEAVKAWRAALALGNNPEIRRALEKAERELAVADDFTSGRTRFFTINLEGGSTNPTLESALLGLLEESYGQLKRRFDYQPSEKISAIFYTRQTFKDITNAPEWAGALNDGKLRVPLGGLNGVNDDLARCFTHELTHSFVYFKARGKCPTWLNEGLAQMMEGKTAARYHSRLAALVNNNSMPPLQILSGSFTGFSTAQAEIAYAYSLTATEMLAERGVSSVIEILDDLGQNYNISVALSRHTRYQNLEAFEQELRQRLME
jgi:tetratricopeptide (TPR) repeat protein